MIIAYILTLAAELELDDTITTIEYVDNMFARVTTNYPVRGVTTESTDVPTDVADALLQELRAAGAKEEKNISRDEDRFLVDMGDSELLKF